MNLAAIIALLACLTLAVLVDAFKVGDFISVFRVVVEGVGKTAHLKNTQFTAEQMGFQEDGDFKARLVGVTAFCQMQTLEGRHEANRICAEFGQRYYPKAAGVWSCASLKGASDEPLCLFQSASHLVPQGKQASKLAFGRGRWPAIIPSQDRIGCRVRNPILDEEESEVISVVADEIQPAFRDRAHFYSKNLIADLKKYTAAHERTWPDSDTETDCVGSRPVEAIIRAFELAGIRYPIGKQMCQLCKRTCNRIVPSNSVDICKYTVCVRRLGGYKGPKSTPTCSEVRLP
ncbi:MAG: hypothetical protein J3R72DRAFT_448516 [Linnemannia gamsii]|nr:MAG: hypothetical protein J3R72DRAFT_448516 [Linnemannia gamsii]